MKHFFIFLFFFSNFCNAQNKIERLQKAIHTLEKDSNMKHGILSLTVLDAKTGKTIYAKNSELGLASASAQKIITAICAYELLGKDFRYETTFSLARNAINKQFTLKINPSFDPTLGSWRYPNTESKYIIDTLSSIIASLKINKLKYLIHQDYQSQNSISDAWIYEDLGNYYGANCEAFMWHENQYDINLEAKQEHNIYIKDTEPNWAKNIHKIQLNLTKDTKATGDNSCIYRMPFSKTSTISGSIGKDITTLKLGASIEGETFFINSFDSALAKHKNFQSGIEDQYTYDSKLIYTHSSPTLDSINYWFLRKSVNLYGEALLRTIAKHKYNNNLDYNKGIDYIHTVCEKLNIDSHAVHLFDGCGLSPQNRVTTNALCGFMQYARSKNYFKHFYDCLPIINEISMKSGSIHGVRAYTGYINSKDGAQYTFAIIVNNYNGSGKEMQAKLWKILDELK